jgi:hypothetical protein
VNKIDEQKGDVIITKARVMNSKEGVESKEKN